MSRRLIQILILLLTASCHKINQWVSLNDDNVIEEAAEELLKDKTGLDLDFTPNTPED